MTVKTRLGWDDLTKNIVEVAERLRDIGIAALDPRSHAADVQRSADWTLIGEVKNNPRMRIPIFGNGDIDSPMKAVEMRQRYGVDGVMIGRASIGYPWIFREIRHYPPQHGRNVSGTHDRRTRRELSYAFAEVRGVEGENVWALWKCASTTRTTSKGWIIFATTASGL